MKLLCRAQQLAEILHEQILEGELANPLPGTCRWAHQLGVGQMTLQQALRHLQKQGIISISNRKGASIITRRSKTQLTSSRQKLVRVFIGGNPNFVHFRWFTYLSQALQTYRISVSLEHISYKNYNRFKVVPPSPSLDELWVLSGTLPEKLQRHFHNSHRPVILIGKPSLEFRFPYVNYDWTASIRHAVHAFGRKKISTTFILAKTNTPSMKAAVEAFQEASQPWRSQKVAAKILYHYCPK